MTLPHRRFGDCPRLERSKEFRAFQTALDHVTRELAWLIVKDGEGVSKFVEVRVDGAASLADARKAAEAIANSTLVKCAWFGEDPNWGRIMDAVGYSGAKMREATSAAPIANTNSPSTACRRAWCKPTCR